MAVKSLAANVRMRSGAGKTREPTLHETLEMVEGEIAVLRDWLAADATSPHIQETGHRLIFLGRYLIELGMRGR